VSDSARVVTDAELGALLGGRRPGLVARLQRLELLERQGDVT